jgi:hypothetical protein
MSVYLEKYQKQNFLVEFLPLNCVPDLEHFDTGPTIKLQISARSTHPHMYYSVINLLIFAEQPGQEIYERIAKQLAPPQDIQHTALTGQQG